jgi:hypothetical protein
MKALSFAVASLFVMTASVPAKVIVVNTVDNVSPGPNQTNLVQAINLLQDGDTIQFNIPGAGIHYIDTPTDGYPLITASGVTIDGYTQPVAAPNSNPLHAPNNAKLMIVLSSTNGNGLSMQTAITNYTGVPNSNLGFGPDELALLGFFRGSNNTVRGFAFLSSQEVSGSGYNGDSKTVSFCPDAGGQCQNWHVSGCWFGIDPTTRKVAYMPDGTNVAMPAISIAAYGSQEPDGSNPTYPQPGTIGVAAGSANAPAEFNVFVTGYGFDSTGLNFRIAGNFWNVLPDGMTNFDPSQANAGQQQGDGDIEIGRVSDNLVIGTDGDGINDADEGNIFGGVASSSWANLYLWSSHSTNIIIAGNSYGVAIDGITRFTNTSVIVHGVPSTAQVQFGSDFDGTSDALEGNVVYNNQPFATQYPSPSGSQLEPFFFDVSPGARIAMRGNKLVNNNLVPFTWANDLSTRLDNFTNYEAAYMSTNGDIIPGLDTNSVFPHLKGAFPVGIAPYTNVIIDVYQLDQEGWTNGKAFDLAELTDSTTYTNGFAQGSKYLGSFSVPNSGSFDVDLAGLDLGLGYITVSANYSADPSGTHRARTQTSNFSTPVTLITGDAASVGITRIVPDVALWYDKVGNFVTNGPISLSRVQTPGTLGNWEPYTSVMGESTFLIGFNTYANDGSFANQNFVVAKQPVAGGPAKLDYEFFDDSGKPFMAQINLSRQNGNPQRVAGDKRIGATNFIVEAETSIGQLAPFQTVNRWTNNPIYQDINRYCSEQIFSLDPSTLAQSPVTNAWDYVYGPYVAAALGAANNAPQCSRTGGRSEFLDNGNIVVMIDDKTALISDVGEVTTFAIITPQGTVLKGPTLVDPRAIWDNMAAFKGGFAIRVQNMLYIYDDNGNLQFTNDVVISSGLPFGTSRGDETRLGSDIRSHYLYLAGQTPTTAVSPVSVGIWDARTGNFVTSATVTDGDPTAFRTDRVSVAVDALDHFCVAFVYQPTTAFASQIAARVMAFDGTNITYLTHSFFPFVNSENNPTNILDLTMVTPNVAITTGQICIAAKGTINSTNNPAGGPDSPTETTVYVVINNPAASPSTPTISIGVSGGQATITYTGTLLYSPNAAGPYQPVSGASSPYVIPATGAAAFYRSQQ